MSFNSYYVDGSVPTGRVNWPGTKLHKRTVYVSTKEPEKQGTEEKEEKIPKHLVGKSEDEYMDELIGTANQSPLDLLGVDFFKKGDHDTHVRKGDIAIMNQALQSGAEDLSEYEGDYEKRQEVRSFMEERIQAAKKELAARQTEFLVKGKGYIELLINPFETERSMIIGPSKCGKSTVAAQLAEDHARTFRDRMIYRISVYEEDPAYDCLGEAMTFQPVDAQFVADVNQGMGEDIKNCMVIFDDIDTIQDDLKRAAAQKLRGHLLEAGRKRGVYVVTTSHVFRAGPQTKKANTESTFVVVFPKAGDHYHITDYLKTYCGMTKEQIHKIMTLPSRWVKIHRETPKYILHEHGGYMIEYKPQVSVKRQRTGLFSRAPGSHV